MTATKLSGVDPTGLVINDDLRDVRNNATLVGSPTATVGTASVTGSTLTWNIPTLTTTATVTYTVRVNDDAYGVTLTNLVTAAGSETCPPPQADPEPECSTTHYTPGYTLTKACDPADGATVQPGDTVTYTLTVTNNSDGVVTGAIVTDDLTDVLDNATLDEASITPTGQATLTGTTLTWNVPTLQPDATATLAYTVTVDDDAFNETLANVATPGPGGECVEDADCTTSHPTPGYVLTKASDPADGATVQPGDTVTYTLTVTNTSDGVVTGATVTDNLSDVLDNATLDEASITPTGRPPSPVPP